MNRLLVWGYFSRKPWAAIQTEEGFLFHMLTLKAISTRSSAPPRALIRKSFIVPSSNRGRKIW